MLTEACSVYQSNIQHIIVLSLKHFHVQHVFKAFKNGLDYNVFFLTDLFKSQRASFYVIMKQELVKKKYKCRK